MSSRETRHDSAKTGDNRNAHSVGNAHRADQKGDGSLSVEPVSRTEVTGPIACAQRVVPYAKRADQRFDGVTNLSVRSRPRLRALAGCRRQKGAGQAW
jgi:hypothetical protein